MTAAPVPSGAQDHERMMTMLTGFLGHPDRSCCSDFQLGGSSPSRNGRDRTRLEAYRNGGVEFKLGSARRPLGESSEIQSDADFRRRYVALRPHALTGRDFTLRFAACAQLTRVNRWLG